MRTRGRNTTRPTSTADRQIVAGTRNDAAGGIVVATLRNQGEQNVALVAGSVVEAVGQAITNDLTGGSDIRGQNQRAGVGGQIQVPVGVDPSIEVKLRTGEIAEIAVGKDAELKNWNQRHLHPARHIDRSSRRANGADF